MVPHLLGLSGTTRLWQPDPWLMTLCGKRQCRHSLEALVVIERPHSLLPANQTCCLPQKLQQGSARALARSHVVYLAGTPSIRSKGCPVCGPSGLFLPENCTDREEGKRETPPPHTWSHFSLEWRILCPSRKSVHTWNLFWIFLVLYLLLLNTVYLSLV